MKLDLDFAWFRPRLPTSANRAWLFEGEGAEASRTTSHRIMITSNNPEEKTKTAARVGLHSGEFWGRAKLGTLLSR